MSPLLVLLLAPLLSSLVTAQNVAWIHPACSSNTVKSFNEARFMAGLVHDKLQTSPADLSDGLHWFFNVESTDTTHLDLVKNTFMKIGQVTRTYTRTQANIRIYCDNARSWKPIDQGISNDPLFHPDDSQVRAALFKHETENVYNYGANLGCRLDSDDQAFVTNVDIDPTSREGIQLPNIIMDICDASHGLPATTADVVGLLLNQMEGAYGLVTGSMVILHELVHVPALGGCTVDGVDFSYPEDGHTIDGETLIEGYYHSHDTLPGHYLVYHVNTISNPDSYAFLGAYSRLHDKGWTMQLKSGTTNQLAFVWTFNKDIPHPDWSIVNGYWRWTGREWDDQNAPNWTNNVTPLT
jgi:hypothetical protein